MAQIYIDIGATPNDRSADSIREGFDKCNRNFTQLFSGGSGPAIPGVNVPGLTLVSPSTLSDFSMFPGSVAPSIGFWMAANQNYIYTFLAGVDTTWQTTTRSN